VLLLTSTQHNLFKSTAISSRLTQLSIIDTLFIAVALADQARARQAMEKTQEFLSQRQQERMKGS